MGREQMRNLDIAKVGAGSVVNEFEYQRQHGEMTEQEHAHELGGKAKRLTPAERIAQVTAAAHKKVEKKRRKAKKSGAGRDTAARKKA